jgi:7,8-dihydro-6-hydroxymethylpterin-pyrophosphokinase
MRTNRHAAPSLESRNAPAFANQKYRARRNAATLTNWIKRGHAIENEAGRMRESHDRCSMDFPVCSGEN